MTRAGAVARIDALATGYAGDDEVAHGTMFRSPGLAVRGRIFAFAGSRERVIVKLPAARGHELLGRQEAEPVTMGTRTMREWFAIPPEVEEASLARLADEARAYVAGLEG